MARPAATSERTNSGVISFGMRCGKRRKTLREIGVGSWRVGLEPTCCLSKSLRTLSLRQIANLHSAITMCCLPIFSRMAMNSISGVMMPRRAYSSCVTTLPVLARSVLRARRGQSFQPERRCVLAFGPVQLRDAFQKDNHHQSALPRALHVPRHHRVSKSNPDATQAALPPPYP